MALCDLRQAQVIIDRSKALPLPFPWRKHGQGNDAQRRIACLDKAVLANKPRARDSWGRPPSQHHWRKITPKQTEKCCSLEHNVVMSTQAFHRHGPVPLSHHNWPTHRSSCILDCKIRGCLVVVKGFGQTQLTHSCYAVTLSRHMHTLNQFSAPLTPFATTFTSSCP